MAGIKFFASGNEVVALGFLYKTIPCYICSIKLLYFYYYSLDQFCLVILLCLEGNPLFMFSFSLNPNTGRQYTVQGICRIN